MNASGSLELVLQFAAREAVGADFEEIHPEHLLMALLKMSELPIQTMDIRAREADVAVRLAAEIAELGQVLAKRFLDSRAVRRALREKMGRGPRTYQGGTIHRSPACKQVFEEAGRAAEGRGRDIFSAVDLLDRLLTAPTGAILAVLKSPCAAALEAFPSPLWAQHCRVFPGRDAAGESPPCHRDRSAESTAVLLALAGTKRKGVWLVGDRDEDAVSVAAGTAVLLGRDDAPTKLRHLPLIDLSSLGTALIPAAERLPALRKLFEESKRYQRAILLLPPVEAFLGAGPGVKVGPLRSLLREAPHPFLCRVGRDVFVRQLSPDFDWLNVAEVIWLSPGSGGDIPTRI
jgi:hypothetical protein